MKFVKTCLLLVCAAMIFAEEVAPAENEPVLGSSNDNGQVDESILFAKYQKFMQKYEKTYGSLQELNERFMNFVENYKQLQEKKQVVLSAGENDQTVNDEDRLELGVSPFFDLSDEEYEKQFLTLKVPKEELLKSQTPAPDAFVTSAPSESDNLRHLASIPTSFDWRTKGAVGVVKNQGACGSCYTFAVAANLEGQYLLKNGKLVNLSEQHIMNCDNLDYGCNGGLMANTFKSIKSFRNGGVPLTSSVKYIARKSTCSSTATPIAKVSGYKFAGSTDGATIASFLVNTGPLAVALNANLLKYYRSGVAVYSNSQCNPNGLNHAVTMVGYGVSGTTKYWIIKNSWGASWGENGYFRMAWGSCGLNTYVLTGILA
jgi:cathepsin F